MLERPAMQPDLEGAKQYALECLQTDLSPSLCYHSIAHTRDDVVPAVERLAAAADITMSDLLLLRTAAYYHDLGYIKQRAGHELISSDIAAAVLPSFGYSKADIQCITAMIMATQLPQRPHTLLEAVLADADLDLLGRSDFFLLNQVLRAELAAEGMYATDAQWYQQQLAFLEAHRYWTSAAAFRRNIQKQRNIATLRLLLQQCPQPY